MPRFLSGSLHLRSIQAVSWGEQLVGDYAKGTKHDMGFGVIPFQTLSFWSLEPSQIDGLNVAKGWDRQHDHPLKVIKAVGESCKTKLVSVLEFHQVAQRTDALLADLKDGCYGHTICVDSRRQ